MKKNTLFLFLFYSFFIIQAQSNQNEKSYFNWFDELTDAQNSHLSNGIAYYGEYNTKKGHHQYYASPDFLIGDLIYDGQPYFDINLQYNLYSDQLILRHFKDENLRTIQLIKDKVERFSLNNRNFTRISNSQFKDSGFYEILLESGEYGLYKKIYKTRQRHINSAGTFFSFREKNFLVVRYQENYYHLDNRKSLLKIFPEKKESINTYFSKRGNFYNANKDEFMKSLLQKIANE